MSNMIITTPKVPSTSFSSGKTSHSKLSNLDFESSGHSGFQRELNTEQIENINNIPYKVPIMQITGEADGVYTQTPSGETILTPITEIKGASGLVPKVIDTDEAPYKTLDANTMTVINPSYLGSITIAGLGDAVEGYDNEWDFQITQGDEPKEIWFNFSVSWGHGIAPTFGANTTTICRLYYVSDTLCGEWVAV